MRWLVLPALLGTACGPAGISGQAAPAAKTDTGTVDTGGNDVADEDGVPEGDPDCADDPILGCNNGQDDDGDGLTDEDDEGDFVAQLQLSNGKFATLQGDAWWGPDEWATVTLDLTNVGTTDYLDYPTVRLSVDRPDIKVPYGDYPLYGLLAGQTMPVALSVRAGPNAKDGVVWLTATVVGLGGAPLPEGTGNSYTFGVWVGDKP